MITNFDYQKNDSKFSRFCKCCYIGRENYPYGSGAASIINSRRAMEFAIKWMYSVDSEL